MTTDLTSVPTADEPIIAMGSGLRPAEPDRTPWPELHPGEKVRLELEVTVGHPLGEDLIYFGLAQDGGKTVSLYLPLDHPQVRVTRTEPVDGVPQPGELWADQVGTVYLVVEGWSEEEPVMSMLAGGTGIRRWRYVHTGPGGPIRRLMTVDEIARLR